MDFTLASGPPFDSVQSWMPLFVFGAFMATMFATVYAVSQRNTDEPNAMSVAIAREILAWEDISRRVPTMVAGELREGLMVRVRGRVRALPARREDRGDDHSLVTHRLTVGMKGRLRSRLTTAVDFRVTLPDSSSVLVDAGRENENARVRLISTEYHDDREARLLGETHWTFQQSVIEGDEVEVLGRLRREVDPTFAEPFARNLPLGWALTSTQAQGLVVFHIPPRAAPPEAERAVRGPSAATLLATFSCAGLMGYILGLVS